MDTRPDRISNLAMLASEMESANPQGVADAINETDAEEVIQALRKLYPNAAVHVFDATGAPGGADLGVATKLMAVQAFLVEKEQKTYEKKIRRAARELNQRIDEILNGSGFQDEQDESFYMPEPKDQIAAAKLAFEARQAAAKAVLSERQKTAKITHDLAAGIVRSAKTRRLAELGTKPSVIVFGNVGSGRAAFSLPVADDEVEG